MLNLILLVGACVCVCVCAKTTLEQTQVDVASAGGIKGTGSVKKRQEAIMGGCSKKDRQNSKNIQGHYGCHSLSSLLAFLRRSNAREVLATLLGQRVE